MNTSLVDCCGARLRVNLSAAPEQMENGQNDYCAHDCGEESRRIPWLVKMQGHADVFGHEGPSYAQQSGNDESARITTRH